MITDICGKCHTCQWTKRKQNKYGKLPAKIAEVQLLTVNMINPTTGWFKIKEIKLNKQML